MAAIPAPTVTSASSASGTGSGTAAAVRRAVASATSGTSRVSRRHSRHGPVGSPEIQGPTTTRSGSATTGRCGTARRRHGSPARGSTPPSLTRTTRSGGSAPPARRSASAASAAPTTAVDATTVDAAAGRAQQGGDRRRQRPGPVDDDVAHAAAAAPGRRWPVGREDAVVPQQGQQLDGPPAGDAGVDRRRVQLHLGAPAVQPVEERQLSGGEATQQDGLRLGAATQLHDAARWYERAEGGREPGTRGHRAGLLGTAQAVVRLAKSRTAGPCRLAVVHRAAGPGHVEGAGPRWSRPFRTSCGRTRPPATPGWIRPCRGSG